MTKLQHILAALLLAGAATASAPAFAQGSGDGAYERGVAALERGHPGVARIEFMNAIQANPRDRHVRLMQALAYLAVGDGVAAESEILRARELGVPADETRHLLANAFLLQNQPQRVIEESENVPPAHAAHAARIRGRAYMVLNDNAAAAREFAAAIAAGPNDSAVWVDVGAYRRSIDDLAAALEAADRAIAANPRNIDALILRGELTRSQYGLAAAVPWFDRALEVDAGHIPARLERAVTYGDLGRMRDMLADTRAILSIAPNNPMALYLQAMLAARARNFELARSLYQRTGSTYDRMPAGMLLASAIDYQTGNVQQAVRRLEQLVAQQPGNRKARRLLAASQWRLGNAAATIATLRPIADRPDADNYTLSLMGRALERQGDTGSASAYLARAAQPRQRQASALDAGNMSDTEFAALRQAAAQRPDHAPTQIMLVAALLSRGLGDEALQRARALQAGNPGTPDAHVLVGDALGIGGDFAGAAQEYRRAANISFSEPTALRMIEALQRSGQTAAAETVLQLFVQQNPRNVAAQLLTAGRFMQARNWPEAIRIYEGLRSRLGNRDATILNNLAWAYSESGNYGRAIPLARAAWNLDRSNPATSDTLGWILFKSGTNRVEGLAMLERAARGAPSDAEVRRHLEEARRS